MIFGHCVEDSEVYFYRIDIVMRNFLYSLSECHPQTSMSNVLEIDCCLEGILTIAITVYQKSYRDMYY